MLAIKKSMLLFSLFFIAASAQATILTCTGKDNKNQILNVSYNTDAQTLDVNGVSHKIVAPTKDRSGVATENYSTDNNALVYDSFIKDSGKYRLHRFNAMTDDTIFDVDLTCSTQK